jgi:hypothetical protein
MRKADSLSNGTAAVVALTGGLEANRAHGVRAPRSQPR